VIFSGRDWRECTVADGRIDRDPIVDHAIESLRAVPPSKPESVARVVAAAARARAQDVAPDEDDLLADGLEEPTGRARRLTTIAAIAAGILLLAGGFALWRMEHSRADVATGSPVSGHGAATSFAAAQGTNGENSLDALLIPTQFVFDGRARHVSLVGDFNNWDEGATPLEREPGSTLWSATVPIQRGRHIYAFMVDSVWTLDKRAPVARDPDFGVTGSVILVGRP